MPRKRKRSDNPLSTARGKKDSEALWHRKSGAGFRLFVEFYARNLEAVCSPTGRHCPETHQRSNVSERAETGSGMSRAAKRRKKKKGKKSQNEQPEGAFSLPTKSLPDEDSLLDNNSVKLKLLSALKSHTLSTDQEDAFRLFLLAISKPLPITFRIRNGLDSPTREALHRMITSFDSLVGESLFFDNIFQAKSSIVSKESVGKRAPDLKAFLVGQSSQGSIARQELGSMLPVLALSKGGWIQEGSKILDLCASPGSKTLQALEIVGAKGRIKANDIKESRLIALKEAVRRSSVKNIDRIKYTMYDASVYPIPKNRLFDAVICDVPCSGDGTIRKDHHILPGWTPNTSNALHSLQVKILKRAIACCRVGGVISYSTCSMNPVEDEAVVCAALNQFGGENGSEPVVELLSWPIAKDFCVQAGLRHWFVADYDGECVGADGDDEPRLRWFSNFKLAVENKMLGACETLWPPEEPPSRLEKCMRLHPQNHDSGGFFVALLKRIK